MKTIRLSFAGRLKHPELFQLAQEYGSVAALARELEMPYTHLWQWTSLKNVPGPENPHIDKIFRLTGKSYDDLFPPELIAAVQGKKIPRETLAITRGVPVDRLLTSGETQLSLPSHEAQTINQENVEILLKVLVPRERKIIRKKFFWGKTFREIGEDLGISIERSRQIYEGAMRKMTREACIRNITRETEKNVE